MGLEFESIEYSERYIGEDDNKYISDDDVNFVNGTRRRQHIDDIHCNDVNYDDEGDGWVFVEDEQGNNHHQQQQHKNRGQRSGKKNMNISHCDYVEDDDQGVKELERE